MKNIQETIGFITKQSSGIFSGIMIKHMNQKRYELHNSSINSQRGKLVLFARYFCLDYLWKDLPIKSIEKLYNNPTIEQMLMVIPINFRDTSFLKEEFKQFLHHKSLKNGF